jgi:ABC-type branched-subunit amino acid transport system ATPase component
VPILECRDLRKTFPGGVEAVRGVSFEIALGEVFGLLGPNRPGSSGRLDHGLENAEGRALAARHGRFHARSAWS